MPTAKAKAKVVSAARPKSEARVKEKATPEKAAADANPVWQQLAMRLWMAGAQGKLSVSSPDDPSERDADRAAERVMSMTTPTAGGAPAPTTPASYGVSRMCGRCEEEEERQLRRKELGGDSDASAPAPPVVHETLNSAGEPLDANTRAFFEPRFGRDFGTVRVHADARAAESARAVKARAYSAGSDIVFGPGEYTPGTAQGRRLLAHELAHVVQQRATGPLVQRVVDPRYVVNESFEARMPPGAPTRIFFPRNSAVIPASESSKLDAFKSGPDRIVTLTLFGLATEDELAVTPTLATDRANAVSAALATPLPGPPPFVTAHAGSRIVAAGTLANTGNRPNLRFNRAVEILRPGEATMSPGTPIAPPTACGPALETAFQAAKVMAFDWIDVTRPEVQARPVTGPVAAALDTFFGNHTAATARRVDHNLGLIRAEVDSLARAGNHDCADPNLPGCVGAIAFNSGGSMTICSGYASRTPEDRARNLVHEAGHSTAGLRVTGRANAPRTSDFSYRHERMIHHLGAINPDQALSNSDSYSMFLMTRRAAGAITPGMLPQTDPAPTGLANAAQATQAQRAVALAEVWVRLAQQGLTDLHVALRGSLGSAVPTNLGDPARLDLILAMVKRLFTPILAAVNVERDDLLMIAGVIDRYDELSGLIKNRAVAITAGAATTMTAVAPVAPATTGSLSLTVAPAFFTLSERARARVVVDKLIELVAATRISAAMRPNYGEFAEAVRNLHQ